MKIIRMEKMIGVRMPPKLVLKLKRAAKKQGKTLSDFVRMISEREVGGGAK